MHLMWHYGLTSYIVQVVFMALMAKIAHNAMDWPDKINKNTFYDTIREGSRGS